MSEEIVFRPPTAKKDRFAGILLGLLATGLLFFTLAFALIINQEPPAKDTLEDTLIALDPPPDPPKPEEPDEPEEKDEPKPELQSEPPKLSLDQLGASLNPSPGSLSPGGIGIPNIANTQKDLGTDEAFDFSDLDKKPQMLDSRPINLPARIRSKYRGTSGLITLFLRLSENGVVTEIRVDSADVPQELANEVARRIQERRFSKPTLNGTPVKAKAILPVPIKIS